MKQYEVKITRRALADMEEIYAYIADKLQAPDTAIRQYNRIADEIESLRIFPDRYMLFDSVPERELGMRQLIIYTGPPVKTTSEKIIVNIGVLS